MGNVRVMYTITVKTGHGKELSFEKVRNLYELDAVSPEKLQDFLEQNFGEKDRTALQHQLEEEITSLAFKITKITELKSAGDDDQM